MLKSVIFVALFLFVIISYFHADLFHYLLYDFNCGLNFHGTLPMVSHWAPGWRWFLPERSYISFCQASGTLPIWNYFKFNSGLWLENLRGRFFLSLHLSRSKTETLTHNIYFWVMELCKGIHPTFLFTQAIDITFHPILM